MLSFVYAALSSASGETDWARELSSAIVRVGAGVFMVHNGLDKLVDPEGREDIYYLSLLQYLMGRNENKVKGLCEASSYSFPWSLFPSSTTGIL